MKNLGTINDNKSILTKEYGDSTYAPSSLTKTVGDVSDAVGKKQDKLTAGENITIEGNVISATGGSGSTEVYVGDDEPTESSVVIWVDTDESAIDDVQARIDIAAEELENKLCPNPMIDEDTPDRGTNGQVLKTNGDSTTEWSTLSYTDNTNKPQINGVTLEGNKTTSDLNIPIVGIASTSNTGTIKLPNDGSMTIDNDGTLHIVDSTTILDYTLTSGETSIVATNPAISDTSMIDVYTSVFGVNPTDIVQEGNTVTLTFDEQESDVSIRLVVR